MLGGYFGQDYFGGSPSTSTATVAGGRSRALVVHLDADVPVSGMASQPSDLEFVLRSSDALITARVTNASLRSRTTAVVFSTRSTDAVFATRSSDTTDFDWQVSP